MRETSACHGEVAKASIDHGVGTQTKREPGSGEGSHRLFCLSFENIETYLTSRNQKPCNPDHVRNCSEVSRDSIVARKE